jgi:hypothetical protein
MKNYLKRSWLLIFLAAGLASCQKNLNRVEPNSVTDNQVFSNLTGYSEAMAKVYGAFATTGSTGPGSGDIGGIDAGTSDFLRLFWNAEELTTDEGLCVWNDPGVPDLHNISWNSQNVIMEGLYYRALYQITVANQFINESNPATVASHGITGSAAATIANYQAEARFLRAYQYWVLLDMFGNPPFVTEKSPIGSTLPPQTNRTALFSYIESELKAIDPLLIKPGTIYGRADEATDWALLARLYLNANVYIGTDHSTDAITYCNKVISAGYSLNPVYAHLFQAGNNTNNPEVIFPLRYDADSTQNYGGTTFIINSSITTAQAAANPGAGLPNGEFGVPNGGWAGNHSLQTLPTIFGYNSSTGTFPADDRAMFYTTGNTFNTTDEVTFSSGFGVNKFSNLTPTGGVLDASNGTFCTVDFPLFRLGEIYLTYAEAVLRGGQGGSQGQALIYFNDLRTRAHAATVTSIALTDIINERAKEMYWEATRRTDLIRFGMFTGGSYLWPFKGGVINGTAIPSYRSLFAIPATDLSVNTNLKQNPGY